MQIEWTTTCKNREKWKIKAHPQASWMASKALVRKLAINIASALDKMQDVIL